MTWLGWVLLIVLSLAATLAIALFFVWLFHDPARRQKWGSRLGLGDPGHVFFVQLALNLLVCALTVWSAATNDVWWYWLTPAFFGGAAVVTVLNERKRRARGA